MKHRLALMISLAGVTLMASTTILASAAEAQRRGGGGGARGGGGGGMSRGSGGGGSWGAQASRPSNAPATRSGSRSNINSGNVNRGNVNTGNINRGNVNTGNINTGNINTGNINTGNINRNINTGDINIDVDHNYGWGGGAYYRPGYGAAVVAGAAVGAAVVGSYYRTLPPSCVTVYRSSISYYQCGSAWYQPVYSGSTVQYVVVKAP